MTFTVVQFPGWVSPTLAAVAVLAGVGALWALFWDWLRRGRLKATRRCPRCWYDMTGAGLACPECGKVARRERDLHRSRRRWVWAVVLVAVVNATYAGRWIDGKSTPEIAAVLPTEVLLIIRRAPPFEIGTSEDPYAMPFRQVVTAEVLLRAWQGRLSPRHRRAVADMQFKDRPPVQLVVPPRWPKGMPLTVECLLAYPGVQTRGLRAHTAWEAGAAGVEVLGDRWLAEPWSPARQQQGDPGALYGRVLFRPWEGGPRRVMLTLGVPPDGATEAAVEVEVREEELVVWRGRVAAPLLLVDSVDEAVTPEVDPGLTKDLEEVFRDGFQIGEDRRSVEMRPLTIPTERVMAAVRVEIVKDGAVLGSCSLVAGQSALPSPNAPAWNGPERPPPIVFGTLEGPGVPISPGAMKGAVVRVTPDQGLALQMLHWSRNWSGTFEVPVAPDRTRAARPW